MIRQDADGQPVRSTASSHFAFAQCDLRDAPALATKLKNPSDPLSSYVRARLQSATQGLLNEWQSPTVPPAELENLLITDFNEIVLGELIWNQARFHGVKIRPECIALLSLGPTESEFPRLNRLLIEDAFPLELWNSSDVVWLILREHLSSSVLSVHSWRCTKAELHRSERMLLVELDNGQRSIGHEDEATDLEVTKASVYSESMFGHLVKVLVPRKYRRVNETLKFIKKRDYVKDKGFDNLSDYFGNLDTLPRCRTAVANITTLGLSTILSTVLMYRYSNNLANWPDLLNSVPQLKVDGSVWPHWLRFGIALMLNVACIRVLFGINYITFDTSFNEVASLQASKAIMFVRYGRVAMHLSVLLLPASLAYNWAVTSYLTVIVLGLFPILFLIVYKEAFMNDRDGNFNLLFTTNDLLFALVAFILLVAPKSSAAFGGDLVWLHLTAFIIVPVVWLSFVAGEMFLYKQSFCSALRFAKLFCTKAALR